MNNNLLQNLLNRRSELIAELERVNSAINSYGDTSPIRICTRKNLRNTPYVTTSVEYAVENTNMLLVFEDKDLLMPAFGSSYEGWVSHHSWVQFKLAHPELIGELVWES